MSGRASGAAGSRGRRTRARPTGRRRGSADASRVRFAQPNRLAASSSPLTRTASKPASCACDGEVRGRERVHVHHTLEGVLLAPAAVAVPIRRPRGGAHQRPPQRGKGVGAALGPRGDPVAVVGRLAAECHHAAWAQHAPELAEGGGEIRQVVEHGVPEHQVEGVVVEGQPLRLARGGLDGQAELGRGALELAQHPGGDVGGHGLADHPGPQQVEREVAGAGADLEGSGVAARLVPERLAQLARDLCLADGAVVDAPLRVVVLGGQVVVADVCVPDGLGRLHEREQPST